MGTSPFSVLIISPSPGVHGGVSVFIETLKSHLTQCIATSFYVGSIPGHTETLFARITRLLTAPCKIAKLARQKKFDVIHINPSFTAKSLLRDGLILLALRLVRARRIFIYFHGWEWAWVRPIEKIALLRYILVWSLNIAARVSVLTPECKNWLIAIGVKESKILLLRTMFDGKALTSIHASASSSRQQNILYMSRLVREKGVYELLGAFVRIAPEFLDAHLIIAGDGEEAEALRVAASCYGLGERISFPGYVEGNDKFALLADCTLFALPTHLLEGMPVALLEAMGAGKPLLTSNMGGIAHIISEPENGIVLNVVNTDTVEAALRRLLKDSEYCVNTGKHNKIYAWERFEAEKVTAEIEALYKDIACQV